MLDKFIICVVHKNYSVLVKDWLYVEEEDVLKSWQKIHDQYLDAMHGKDEEILTILTKEINVLKLKINVIGLCITRLTIAHSDEIVKELKQYIYVNEALDPKDPEQYLKDLQRIANRMGELRGRLRDKETELKDRLPDSEIKIDRAYYDRQIMSVSKYMKFQVNKYKTSVGEFVAMLAEMIRVANEMEVVNRKNEY